MAENGKDSTKLNGMNLSLAKEKAAAREKELIEKMNKPTPTMQKLDGVDESGKKTVLGDDASIYRKREEKSEKQKWSEMTKPQKWGYFRDYYLKFCIIGVLVALLVGNLVYTIIKGTPEQMLNVAVLDNVFEADFVDKAEADMTELMVTDPEEQEVFIDTEYYLSSDEYTVMMKLMSRIAASEIDVIIARRDRFASLAANSAFQDISLMLSKEQKAELEEKYEMCSLQDADIETDKVTYGEPTAFGIHLEQFDDYNGYDLSDNPLIIGITSNCTRPENAMKFVEYLFNLSEDD